MRKRIIAFIIVAGLLSLVGPSNAVYASDKDESSHSGKVELSLVPSYENVRISGVRAYKASQNINQSNTPRRHVARISLCGRFYRLIESGVSYAYINRLGGSGVSSSGNVFNEPGVYAAVVTPYAIAEDIHDLALYSGLIWDLENALSFSAGPELHYFISEAIIANRTFKSNDWRLGAYVTLRGSLSDHWLVQGSYRFVEPPDRRVHFFGFGVGYVY